MGRVEKIEKPEAPYPKKFKKLHKFSSRRFKPDFSNPLNNLGFKASTKLPCHFSRSSGHKTKKVRSDKPLTCGFSGRDDRI